MSIISFAPHIVVNNGTAAINFYKKAFGAEEVACHKAPGSDKIMHASLRFGQSSLMLSDDFSGMRNCKSETPDALGGTPVVLHLHTDNADVLWEQAVAAGAKVVFPLADQFWGDRYGQLMDPFGHKWSIGQTIAKPSAEEIEKAAAEAFKA